LPIGLHAGLLSVKSHATITIVAERNKPEAMSKMGSDKLNQAHVVHIADMNV